MNPSSEGVPNVSDGTKTLLQTSDSCKVQILFTTPTNGLQMNSSCWQIVLLVSVFACFRSNASIWPLPSSLSLSGAPLPISSVFTFKTSSTSGVLKRGMTRYLEIIQRQLGTKSKAHSRADDQNLSELVVTVGSDNESLHVDTSYRYMLKISSGQANIEAKTPYGAL